MSEPNGGRLDGKAALVTGAAGGIGFAVARCLARQGGRVALADLDGEAARAAARTLEAEGLAAIGIALDVTREGDWPQAVAAVVAQWGGLQVLVNNAGIAVSPPPGFDELPLADWQRVMRVNLDGTFLGTREGVRAMKAGGGAIVNIGSVAAYVGTPGGAAYGASKGGVRSLTRQAAVNCARNGWPVRVNAVHPSWVWTPMVEQAMQQRFGAEGAREALAALHPFRQVLAPEDVAQAVLFLASDESRFVNGSDLVLDGGLLAT